MIEWIKNRWAEYINRPRVIEHATVNFAVIENWDVPKHEVQLLEPVKVPQVEAREKVDVLVQKFTAEQMRLKQKMADAKTVTEQEEIQRAILQDEVRMGMLDMLARMLEK